MADKFLPTAELTESGRPVLRPGEIESSILSSVDLESDENPNFPLLKSGLLVLTTHRLLWLPPDTTTTTTTTATAVFVPLAAISHIFTPKKSLKTMFAIATPRIRFQVSVTPDGNRVIAESSSSNSNNPSGSRSMVITVVMRGKGDCDAFFGKLWEAWKGRAWASEVSSSGRGSNSVPLESRESSSSSRGGRAMVGVSGILRKEQEMWESMDKSLQDAFQDLNALMSKAKEMVILAEKMRQKLLSGSNSQTGATNDEEVGSKQEMQDWLLSVGIASPVTKESAGALYHQQLSRQLADFVKVPLERAGGMMNLIDIYCLFNRARGTELISPEDLLRACSIWETFDVPVMLRKFDSGVVVIQTKSHSDEEVFAKIKSLLLKPDALQTGVSASDAAMTLGIAPAMAKEHLLTAESKGLLCRDISPNGFRFYCNLFPEVNLDDIYLVKGHGTYNTWVVAASAPRDELRNS